MRRTFPQRQDYRSKMKEVEMPDFLPGENKTTYTERIIREMFLAGKSDRDMATRLRIGARYVRDIRVTMGYLRNNVPRRRMSEAKVRMINDLYASGLEYKEIARQVGCVTSTVWSHIKRQKNKTNLKQQKPPTHK